MESQPLMLKDATLLQEYQQVDNASDLAGKFSRFELHDLFLASKNNGVNPYPFT